MNDAAPIVIRFDRASEATRALRQLRRWGLRAPRDHVIVEGLRVVLILLPAGLLLLGMIPFPVFLAFFAGYFAHRWSERYAKPALLRRFGPRFAAAEDDGPLEMRFDAEGITSRSDRSTMRLDWTAVPAASAYPQGVVIRILPERSLMIPASKLPPGMDPEAFAARTARWREAAA